MGHSDPGASSLKYQLQKKRSDIRTYVKHITFTFDESRYSANLMSECDSSDHPVSVIVLVVVDFSQTNAWIWFKF